MTIRNYFFDRLDNSIVGWAAPLHLTVLFWGKREIRTTSKECSSNIVQIGFKKKGEKFFFKFFKEHPPPIWWYVQSLAHSILFFFFKFVKIMTRKGKTIEHVKVD